MLNPKYTALFRTLFLCFISALLLGSCDVINPSEPIPAFLRIDSIDVATNYQVQGTASSDITEAWVFIDGQLQGVHDLPVKTPILDFGEHELTILAGIKRNGISGLRVDYPFYTSFKSDANFVSGDTINLNPLVGYTSPLSFFNEDFEDPGIKLITAFQSDTNIRITRKPEEVFERNGSGIITADSSNVYFFIQTDERFTLLFGQPIFLELNYKTDEDFEIGIVSHFASSSIPSRVSYVKNTIEEDLTTSWRKIYIDVSTAINNNNSAEAFDFYISGQTSAIGQTFLFDNIKLVYR